MQYVKILCASIANLDFMLLLNWFTAYLAIFFFFVQIKMHPKREQRSILILFVVINRKKTNHNNWRIDSYWLIDAIKCTEFSLTILPSFSLSN